MSKDRQLDMPGEGRSFRRRCNKLWDIWPIPSLVDEVYDVIHIEGKRLAKNAVILIACSKDYILSWHLAHGENSQLYTTLLSKITPPSSK